MKINLRNLIIRINPKCFNCKNEEGNPSEATPADIGGGGWPICSECGSDLDYMDEAEVDEEPTNARITWTPADIQTLRPGWTLDQCEEWLGDNARRIEERSVELGWEVIECLLDMEEGEPE